MCEGSLFYTSLPTLVFFCLFVNSHSDRHEFDPWVKKISWRRKWQPSPVILAWNIPWTEDPGGLQSMGPQRVGHDLVTRHTFFISGCGALFFNKADVQCMFEKPQTGCCS